MVIAVISDDRLKEELLTQGTKEEYAFEWLEQPVNVKNANCYIDLLFDYSAERINTLNAITSGLVIVNAVNTTTIGLPGNFIRICGWSTFLCRPVIEANTADDNLKKEAAVILSGFNKSVEWTPDIAGFISPRVISMLINEAYYTLEDKVTGKEEIDIAMKLGTRYPLGPFEWSQQIGLKNVYELLENLSAKQKRYIPCRLLKQEAFY